MENSCVLKHIDIEGQYQVNKAFNISVHFYVKGTCEASCSPWKALM